MISFARACLIPCTVLACNRTEVPSTPPDHAGGLHVSSPDVTGGAADKVHDEPSRALSPATDQSREPLPPCTATTGRSLGLQGLTQDQVRTRFGSPIQQESFRVEERQGEFYGPIANTYPTTDPKNRNVPLEEWTWSSDDCFLTVWFHRPQGVSKVLDDFYWHKDAAF